MSDSQFSFPKDGNQQSIQALQPTAANNTVTITPAGSSTQSSAISANAIRIAVSASMNIEFGANPSANTTTSFWMPANSVEYFAFISGQKVAANGTGNVYITPVA